LIIGLGTAQFGSSYGISNNCGVPDAPEVENIINAAYNSGVRLFDTAPAYKCEQLLSRNFENKQGIKIVTKFPAITSPYIAKADIIAAETELIESIRTMEREHCYAILTHSSKDLLKNNGEIIWERMISFKEKGLADKVGFSVYSVNELDNLLDKYIPDIVQLPVSIFDQNFITSSSLKKLKNINVEIHARSIFLQGLLLMETKDIHPYFNSIHSNLVNLRSFIDKQKISPLQACLLFVLGIKVLDHIIVGVNSLKELNEIMKVVKKPIKSMNFIPFAVEDELITNPSKWPR